jgi:hypothetical protein
MGNIHRTKVSLRIFGDDLIPETISGLLQCKATEAVKKNDLTGYSQKRDTARTGSWHFNIDENDPSTLEQKIEKLLIQMTENPAIWKRLTTDFKVDIFCGLFLEEFNEGFNLSPEVLKKLSDRNLEIGFDIYLP